MKPTADALQRLHTRTLGQPWLLAAITVLGMWGIWRGIVQRRTIETTAGLLAAVVMMAAALFVIARPAQTIGQLSAGANDVSLGFLSGTADGTLRHPTRTVAGSSRSVFDAVVLRPWCAMNFADVHWCLQKAPGDELTRAERWLRYEPDTRPRNAEWQIIDDPDSEPWTNQPDVLGIEIPGTGALEKDDQKIKDQLAGYHPTKQDRERVQIQGKGQTVMRVALFVFIAAGMSGCIILLGWLSVNVLLQGLLTLVLLLAAPAMLFAPAFGEPGRRLFATWAKKLLAAAVAKAVYALLLAIVLAIKTIIGDLDTELPWLAVWLVSAIFWWGTYLKRNELLGWLSLGTQRPNPAGRETPKATGPVATVLAGATAGPAAAALASSAIRETNAGRREDQRHGIQAAATDQLRDRATQRLDHRYDDLHHKLTAHDDAKEKTQGLNKRITGLDRTIDQAKNQERTARTDQDRKDARERKAKAEAQRTKLVAQRKALEPKLLQRSEEGVARKFIESADRSSVETGQRYSPKQLDLQIEELRADTAHPASDERHSWRKHSWKPGLPESQIADLPASDRAQLHRHIQDQLDQDRALLAAIGRPDHPTTKPTRSQLRKARTAADSRSVKDHTRRARDHRRDPSPPTTHHR